MEKLECPFNWGFGNPKKVYEYSSYEDEALIPLVRLMKVLMRIFAACKKEATTTEENQRILLDLRGCDAQLSLVERSDTDRNLSHDVIQHIVQGTRVFVYSFLANKQLDLEMEEALSSIEPVDLSDKKARSTLFGCKSICWAKYAHADSDESEKLIREAIEDNQNCDLWYFVLGRILRKKRRNFTFGSPPKEEEKCCFSKAYSLSKNNPVYTIFFGQMLREKCLDKCLSKPAQKLLRKEAIGLYEQVLQQNPEKISILLRLALGFMALGKLGRAKQCLDKIPEPPEGHHKRSMYLHYQGRYHLKSKRYLTAANFLQEAAKEDNLGADYQYIACMRRVDSEFKVSEHLRKMEDKYSVRFPAKQTQRILLMLAISYWKNDDDIGNSLSYFEKALAVDPKSEIFTNCNTSQVVEEKLPNNIFKLLEKKFLPHVYKEYSSCKDIIEMADTIKKYCFEHRVSQYRSDSTVRPFDSSRLDILMENLSAKRAK
ncbi:hypothetical protein QAD02_017571 [Eretmocerus hayati]|uniref:Uncharacterized protein n=1 Tax=Eretmocerus hayati TaxID=131215 RepID=A0ACC2PEP5_9HYME|nr:hypothetical protein QAD02_017571 [Eretmocerus hayati]